MNFEIKKIGDAPEQKTLNLETNRSKPFPFRRKFKKIGKWQYIILLPIFSLCISFVFYLFYSAYSHSSDKNFLDSILHSVLSEIKKDENGFVNILLTGQGGKGHNGPELTDTMIVASIDLENKNVVMLSVPRDFWVKTKQFGESRINEVYRNTKNHLKKQFHTSDDIARKEALRFLSTEIEKIIDLKIQHHAQIDFDGFINIVNYIGGIEVDVKNDIYDATYPDGNWGYEVFELKKGNNTLDGETALKYARSRHGSSDFDRAERQQDIIYALKSKAFSIGLLSSPRKIKQLYNIINDNFYSSLGLKELISIAIIGSQFERKDIKNFVLNDDWNSAGGFLGTPPRADYGGAFVLIPYSGFENFERIHLFSKILFQYRNISLAHFEVLNGTNKGGLATKAAKRLERYGLNISAIANAKNDAIYDKSELHVYSNDPHIKNAFSIIEEILPIKYINKIGYYEETDVAASFIIGKDYK
jgi:polyisoprenyl-teichoic acid--peptidoglycan teichoic acid transferase